MNNYFEDNSIYGIILAGGVEKGETAKGMPSLASVCPQVGAVPVAVLATASPCKFEASVTQAKHGGRDENDRYNEDHPHPQ